MIEETSDEKLLGVIMSRNMTWNTHLYGNKKTGKDNIQGLVPQLSQLIAQLSKVMTTIQASSPPSFFMGSSLSPMSGAFLIWMTKEDCRKLQVLHNKVLRIRN